MKDKRHSTGAQGEHLAAAYLQKQGYTLITANWRCQHGEIDLVMQQGEMLVFVEVKTRRSAITAPAFDNITPRKRARLVAAVHAYLAAHPPEDAPWRIDAVAVALPRTGQPLIDHVEDALDW